VKKGDKLATIFVGIIAVLFFGLTFWQGVAAAIVIGNALGAVAHGLLTSWGTRARAGASR
jgi:NCS1 family nucleobase:cation symporter-1